MATNSDFTIADVLAWARTKPADENYCFYDARNCALARFGKETGRPQLVGIADLEEASDKGTLPSGLYEALNNDAAECTFGRLAARLKELCPNDPVPASEWTAIDAYLTDIEAVSVSA